MYLFQVFKIEYLHHWSILFSHTSNCLTKYSEVNNFKTIKLVTETQGWLSQQSIMYLYFNLSAVTKPSFARLIARYVFLVLA